MKRLKYRGAKPMSEEEGEEGEGEEEEESED